MSLSFQLDSKNNIVHNRNFVLISDKAALIQDIKTRLYMYKGEYPYYKNKGISGGAGGNQRPGREPCVFPAVPDGRALAPQ